MKCPAARQLHAAARRIVADHGGRLPDAEAPLRALPGIGRYTAAAILSIAFGRPFLANPDLVERLRRDAPLNTPEPSLFYGGDGKGYTDYPTLQDAAA